MATSFSLALRGPGPDDSTVEVSIKGTTSSAANFLTLCNYALDQFTTAGGDFPTPPPTEDPIHAPEG